MIKGDPVLRIRSSFLVALVLASLSFGQTNSYPYILKSLAGAFPLGDGGPATSALLFYPYAAVSDSAGNVYILDSSNERIRKVTPDGNIATFAQFVGSAWDMKMGPDGSLYVGGAGTVLKFSKAGSSTVVAGTGTYGHSGDGGPAVRARIGDVYAVALDTTGNLIFTDVSSAGSYIREVGADGTIHTIAGTSTSGFNGDNQPASVAELWEPNGLTVDSSGNIYVADTMNSRIRKFTVGGIITTVAGNGKYGSPLDSAATNTPLGSPLGLTLDGAGNLYTVDYDYDVVLKISPQGLLSHVAGDYSAFGAPSDGPATSVSLMMPVNVSSDSAGNLLLSELSHRVRKIANNTVTAVAGKMHFAGDGGPATAALLNEPNDVAIDASGNVFISDGHNYRIRKVAGDGTISTFAGNGIPGYPSNGTFAANAHLPYAYQMAMDSSGNLYIAGGAQVLKITPGGNVSIVAGTGYYGDSGDGGPATAARFEAATGVAVDPSGNVYVADSVANRVRMISGVTGIISAFAGTGAQGRSGDGGLATGAQLNLFLPSPLAADSKGNLYIADGVNLSVRMVGSNGIITTVVGNGALGDPDNVTAATASFSIPIGLATDAAGNLYLASNDMPSIYRVSGGIIRRIAGGTGGSLADGTPALSAAFFSSGIKVDANGDVFAADGRDNAVRELILNSPTGFRIAAGNNQTGQSGQTLPIPLKVQLDGRSGFGVAGIPVSFAVTSGSATLSAQSTSTDNTGAAAILLTLGSGAGDIAITATASGTGLPALQFTEAATAPAPVCSVPQPVVSLVRSAGDFGGSSTIAPGTWIEIYGSNLSQTTRPWQESDFSGGAAATSLDGVTVTINGKPAYPSYISPNQINIQAPADLAIGSVPLIVTTASCASPAFLVAEAATSPGVLSPASFSVNGKQYLVAVLPDGAYVGNPNLVAGLTFRPAKPGDIITVYGIGFGDVSPVMPPGFAVSASNSLPNPTVTFGSTLAGVQYAGLAVGALGLYQFNIIVPNVEDADVPVTFQVGGVTGPQTVYLTIHQ